MRKIKMKNEIIIKKKKLSIIPKKGRKFWFQAVMAIVMLSILQIATYGTPGVAETKGGRPSGSYTLSDFDNVNLFNGNLNVSVPLLKVGGRGEAQFTIPYTIETRHKLGVGHNGGPGAIYTYYPELINKVIPTFGEIEDGTVTTNRLDCYGDGSDIRPEYAVVAFNFKTADGTVYKFHPVLNNGRPLGLATCGAFPVQISAGNEFETYDGSGAKLISDYPIYHNGDTYSMKTSSNGTAMSPKWTLLLPNGLRYRIENTSSAQIRQLTDRNGNFIYFSTSVVSGIQITTITDSVGRVVTVESGQNESPYGLHTKITYKGTGGATRIIRAHGGTIWLPDNRTYSFTYNGNYELTRVVLPTGGAYEYSWGGTIPPPTEPGQAPNDVPFRYLTERRVYADGTNLTSKTVFSEPTGTTQVDGYDPSNNLLSRSKHYFHGVPKPDMPSPERVWQDEADEISNNTLKGKEYLTENYASNGSTLLRKQAHTWQIGRVVTWNLGSAKNIDTNARISSTVSTLADTNLVSKVDYSYNQGNWANVPFNIQTDVYEYDFGSGSPGAFMRRTHTDYVEDTNYRSNTTYILKLPTQTWISSDTNGSNIVSRTQIEYDNYNSDSRHAPLASRSSVIGHDTTNFGTSFVRRGNPTQTVSFGNAANQTDPVYSSIQYDILGNPVKTIDANGNASLIYYYDNFGAPNAEARTNSAPGQLNGNSTFAFATSATNPTGWTIYAQFDYFTGAMVDAEDIHGNVSSSFYNDALDRPTQSILANNTGLKQQTSIVYDDANRRIQSTSDLFNYGDNLAKSESFYDGLGRTFESRNYRDGTYVISNTEYDALGRVKRVTNPYKPGESQLWTTTTYDALSRPLTVTTPDNAVVSTTYSGNTKTVTDQAGKKRKGVADALGRTIQVIEDPTGQNLVTDYVFDTVGNLRRTIQGEQNRYFMFDSLGRLLRAKQPEQYVNSSLAATDPVTGNTQWSVGYTYDNNGNITSTMDARGVVIAGTYDNLNRLTVRDYSDATPDVYFTYDGAGTSIPYSKGKTTEISSSVSVTKYTSFDNLGRVKSSQQITGGNTYNFSDYSYTLAGQLVSQVYPSGRVVSNQFENDGDLSQVNGSFSGQNKTYVGNFSYTSAGGISAMQLGNGRWETAQFNSRFQVTQIGLGTASNNQDILKLNYDYGTTDNNGAIKAQQITVTGQFVANQNYTYDSLNRLQSSQEVINSQQIWKQTFQYDRYGNRKFDASQTTTLGGCPTNVCNPDISTATNRLSGSSYDQAGNVTQDAENKLFYYDAASSQKEVRNASNQVIGQYFYDGEGKRVQKTATQENTFFIYDAFGKMVAEYLITASASQTPQTRYLTEDHLGSPRVITDSSGNVVSRHDYMAFGEEIARSNYGADSIRDKFTGYERDIESNLDYAQARYYNSRNGRFTSVDPLTASATIKNPQTFNRYSYGLNSPYKFTDPLGLAAGHCSAEFSNCYYDDMDWELDRRNQESAIIENVHTAESPQPASATSDDLDRGSSQTGQETNGIMVPGSSTAIFNCMAWALGYEDRWISPNYDKNGTIHLPGFQEIFGRSSGGKTADSVQDYPKPIVFGDGSFIPTPKLNMADIPRYYGGKRDKNITADSTVPSGQYKIVIFEDPKNPQYTHVMRQESNGTWSSKNGEASKWIGIKDPVAFYNTHYNNSNELRANLKVMYFLMPNKIKRP